MGRNPTPGGTMTNPEDPFASPGEQPPQPPPGYGAPPPPPGYGTPPPAGYGAPPPPGYGTPPPAYGAPAPAYGEAPQAAPYGAPLPELATWGQRAIGGLIDFVLPGVVADLVQISISRPLGQLLSVAALAWALYNAYLAGTTGQSIGKKTAGIRLVREQDGQLVGGGLAIGRYFLHVLDALPCLLGFLWPLWDAKRQTFADKILKTLVIKA